MTPEVALAFPYVNDAHLECGDIKGASIPAKSTCNFF